MKSGHLLIVVGFILAMSACGQTKKQDEETKDKKTEMHHNEQKKHHSNAANEQMHKSSVDDLIERFESPERDAYQKPEKVLEYLGDISDKKIIDIGAGSGYFSVKLAEKGAKVIAADVSEEFQASLKKRIEENDLKNIELRKIPYDSPGLSQDEVDMILIVNTYHHIENRTAYFANAKNGIRENGELVVIDFFKKELPVGPNPDHKISKEIVIDELKQAGYKIVDVNVDLLPYQYIIKAR